MSELQGQLEMKMNGEIKETDRPVEGYDENGNLISKAAEDYKVRSPQPGWQELGADSIKNAVLANLKKMFVEGDADPSKVAGIGISCLCPGLAAIGENGEILQDPIIYSDRRSVEEAMSLENRFRTSYGLQILSQDDSLENHA